MKKRLAIALAALPCLLALMAGCSNDDPDVHTLNIRAVSSDSNPIAYYADQTADSIEVVSTDTWQANTNCDWIKFRQSSSATIGYTIKYVYGQALSQKERVVIAANTTGEDRTTTVTVDANNKKVGLVVKQFGHLNVTTPAKSQTVNTSQFIMRLKAAATTAKVAFRIYANAQLTTADSWITVPDDVFEASSKGAEHETTISLAANTTGAERTGKITLKSTTGATTDIKVVQSAQ